ncbi:hypothetical protein NSQ95_16940 [Psychrobacillus sp. FSL W7-1457]|uniref:hypothetical protein n=1 Tax=unclassified Psychrobacillus TaxID=2636677 RepID=UPI0030F9FA4B
MSGVWIAFIVGLLPIVLILLISFVLIGGIKKGTKNLNGSLQLKKYIIFIYVVILFIAMLVYELIPNNHLEPLTKEEVQVLEAENIQLEEALRNYEGNNLTERFLIDEWSHELSGNTLSIGYEGADSYSTRFVIEWTDANNQLIEGKVYRSNSIIEGIHLDKIIPLHELYWAGNHLSVKEPIGISLEFSEFSNRLVSLPKASSDDTYSFTNVRGMTYIHLKVPKHIEIDDALGLQIY